MVSVRSATVLLLLLVMVSATAIPKKNHCPPIKYGYLNVHIVCHTHNDAGWLKTVDQYYYGSKSKIQRAGVQYILDTVVSELQKDPSRKFSYVETIYFHKWWNQQNDKTRQIVKRLVSNGQLELLNGGWVMNDEANTHYTAIIDQMSEGLRFLNETFGAQHRPRVGWQIDPFGHSSTQAKIFAEMGFDGLFLGRIDHSDKEMRWKLRNMEFIWNSDKSLSDKDDLFTGILPNTYHPPEGLCFDDTCSDDPIMDDPNMKDNNLNHIMEMFMRAANTQGDTYRSNHIMMTMGDDFNYQNANTWFRNLDKLIKHANALQTTGTFINVAYSTPSCYIEGVHNDSLTWKEDKYDFFPYSSDSHSYWAGYFTSRPSLKGAIRKANSFLRILKQLATMRNIPLTEEVSYLSKTLALLQHHDAVTGTAKQHVTDDYMERLSAAVSSLDGNSEHSKNVWYDSSHSPLNQDFSNCPKSNISSCSFIESKERFNVVLYNPIARPISKYIRFPVMPNVTFEVRNIHGSVVDSQLVAIPKKVLDIPYRKSKATHELLFLSENIKPLGISQYHVIKKTAKSDRPLPTREPDSTTLKVIGFDHISLAVNQSTGRISEAHIKTANGTDKFLFDLQLMYYSAIGKDFYRSSGAYIFRPNGEALPFGKPNNTFIDGPLVKEIHQSFASWGTIIVKLYKTLHHIEIEWIVGPIPVDDGIGKEVIVRYTFSNITNDGRFFTDSNGRGMNERILYRRPNYVPSSGEPIAGNYYPVTSKIILKSSEGNDSVAILTDRSQGGSSLNPGELELMVHRRLLYDDGCGVGEPLNEQEFGEGIIVRGTHSLIFSSLSPPNCSFVCHHTRLAEQIFMSPFIGYTKPTPAVLYDKSLSGLTKPLPEQIHLLSLDPTPRTNEFILRLEHMYEKGADKKLSKTVYVDIENLLRSYRITKAWETTLAADQYKWQSKRLRWRVARDQKDIQKSDKDLLIRNIHARKSQATKGKSRQTSKKEEDELSKLTDEEKPEELQKMVVTLDPFQIKTFIITLEKRK